MARVFLSYARADADAAKRLAELVARAGHEVWWDREIQGGSRFSNEIDKALSNAEAVVVLWSAASLESAWVQDEAAEGRDSGRLVPVLLEQVRPPLGFRQYQSIDCTDLDTASGLAQLDALLRTIAKMDGAPEQPSALASGPSKAPEATYSICVLPFLNMSGDPEQEYFSDGITEDIITDLSQVSALSVIARNTAFTFKGKPLDVKEVARTVGVSHVLEGSVRKAGSRVRITAQLIDGAKGDHVWAERFDRELTDIFDIQDEISKAIVGSLRLKLLPQEKKAIAKRGTTNVDAYNLYLMARRQWVEETFGEVRREQAVIRICQQAIAIDPDYADAWALMALAQAELRFWHGRDENALPATERALSINSDLAEVRCVRARYLEEDGKQDEANAEISTALELDPESWEVNREAARMIFRQGRYGEAIPYFEKAASLIDTDFLNPLMLITCYQATGDETMRQASARLTLERAERALAHDPTNAAAMSAGVTPLALFGEEQRARDWMQRGLLTNPDSMHLHYNFACTLVNEMHDHEAALEMIEPYFEKVQSPTMIRHLEVDPDFDSLRDNPRFCKMLAQAKQRLGITDGPAA
ncbi:MAG: TIR domain-containing protein [Pseudomonadota bacterium]|nr:TIR domain-containing protein [Sphingomonas sp.]MDQ3479131.1 TIR domain-containing protein [Pseudomonadota bacterium]